MRSLSIKFVIALTAAGSILSAFAQNEANSCGHFVRVTSSPGVAEGLFSLGLGENYRLQSSTLGQVAVIASSTWSGKAFVFYRGGRIADAVNMLQDQIEILTRGIETMSQRSDWPSVRGTGLLMLARQNLIWYRDTIAALSSDAELARFLISRYSTNSDIMRADVLELMVNRVYERIQEGDAQLLAILDAMDAHRAAKGWGGRDYRRELIASTQRRHMNRTASAYEDALRATR